MKNCVCYSILGYTLEGKKELSGLWLNETESKNKWMQIFDEIKTRCVEDVFFISMNGVSGLEENLPRSGCTVMHLKNAIKYVPSKDYNVLTQALKKVYGA
jgi:transposase-like protein